MRLSILIPVLCIPLALASACGDDETNTTGAGGSTTGGCVDYANVDTNACNGGPCSFAADVMPVFQGACAISSSCHLTGANPLGEGLGLGPSASTTPTQAEVDAVHAALVGVPAVRSSLNLVEPGDPARSWLVAKVDYRGDKNTNDPRPLFTDCAALSCGTIDECGNGMPDVGGALDEQRASILRAWVAAGAPNN